MFDDLTEERTPLWKRIRFGRKSAGLCALALACLTLPAYDCTTIRRLKSEGELATAHVYARFRSGGRGSNPWKVHYKYSFVVNGRRYNGSWWDSTTYLGPKVGDNVAIVYLPSDPNVSRVGQKYELLPGTLDTILFVGALILGGLSLYRTFE